MLSMSIGGVLVIRNNYSYTISDTMYEQQAKGMYLNGDFIMQVNSANDERVGLSDEDIKEIRNTEGINEVKTARILQSRLVLPKKDLLEKDFNKQLDSEVYVRDVLNGSLIDDKKNDAYLMKQKLKGYNDEMLKSLKDYLVSGKIDIEKMKKENLAVVYMPYIYDDNGMKS